MIYTGLNRTGEIETVKAHGGYDVAEVYGSMNYQNPIFYSRKTLTGTSPLTFKGLGQPLKDYHIFGETVQDGTPSPDYPVDVQGVGEKTVNLFDKDSPDNADRYAFNSTGVMVAQPNFTISGYISVNPNTTYAVQPTNGSPNEYGVFYDSEKNVISTFKLSGYAPSGKKCYVGESPSNAAYVRISVLSKTRYPEAYNRTMLTKSDGTILFPYEPYGYKIPVTIGNVTTPIYIGSEPLYRVGEYADEIDFANQQIIRRIDPTTMQPYATPITSTITVPQLTAAVGDNTLTVDTTVKPSSVSITGHIKPTGYGQLLDVNDVDIQDSTGEPIYIQG